MEGDKKRKRAADGEAAGGGRRRKEEREKKAVATTPMDEEADEFFAILRRMHVAVKYFENGLGNGNGNGRKLTGRWATALEAEVLAGVNNNGAVKAAAAEESVFGGARENCGALDLNAVPEGESNSF